MLHLQTERTPISLCTCTGWPKSFSLFGSAVYDPKGIFHWTLRVWLLAAVRKIADLHCCCWHMLRTSCSCFWTCHLANDLYKKYLCTICQWPVQKLSFCTSHWQIVQNCRLFLLTLFILMQDHARIWSFLCKKRYLLFMVFQQKLYTLTGIPGIKWNININRTELLQSKLC